MALPGSFGIHVARHLLSQTPAAWAELDREGRVLSSGHGLAPARALLLRPGASAPETLPFLEELFPFDGSPVVLPRVLVAAEAFADVHLFPTDEGCGILLLDVSDEVHRERRLQQRSNELALLRRDRGLSDSELTDFFRAADMVVVERDVSGRFLPLAGLPSWAGWLVPFLDAPEADWSDDPALAFLAVFLPEARAFWDSGTFGSTRSGLWVHPDADGTEHIYEAAAVYTGSRGILVVERGSSSSRDKGLLIQKGRELALSHKELSRERAALESDRERLEERVVERTRRLALANERLSAALLRRAELEEERAAMIESVQNVQRAEALGTLAGGIAHDFNNILAAIVGFADLGASLSAPDGEEHEAFSSILEAAERAQDLIRQILFMSRRVETEAGPVRVDLVVEEALRLVRATLPAGIQVRTELEGETTVTGNATEVHQIVTNLCTNAAHAMADGGGVLKVSLHTVALNAEQLSALPELRPGAYALLEVRDTGMGISDGDLARIFDPFFTTKDPGVGTGIGLSVVHGIVQRAGGAVTVDSRVGIGSAFRVYWPSVEGEATEAEVAAPRGSNDVSGSERILVVDDEPMQADLARKMLERLGYWVVSATSGHDALDAFRAAPKDFDLVVTDLGMPGATGEAVAAEVRRVRPDVPVLVLTGHAPDHVRRKLEGLGVARVLTKPLPWRQIARTIREVLDGPE